MSSLIRDKNGSKRIQFMLAKGDRRTIRLGKINVKAAEAFKVRVESLIDSVRLNTPINPQTAEWLADLPEDTYAKLILAGLAKPRAATIVHTLDDLLDEYFDTMSVKESTRTRYAQTKRLLLAHFGKDHPLESITPRDADKWRSALEAKGFAPAKIARDVSVARMFFKQAARWGMIPSNPFEGVRAGAQTNRDRMYYLTPEDSHKLIEAAPDADWRCIIALARFGGLRCPSEVLGVRWGDVDWDKNRMLVRSPKTERHTGKGERMVPLFPELQTILQDAFDRAPEGAVFVVNRYRDTSANPRTNLNRIINRAGMTAWPRLFNAMRASRATELASQYPAAICTAWMGHTQAIAEAHYHMVRDEDFARAAITTASNEPARSEADPKSGAESSAATSRTNKQPMANRGANERGIGTYADPCRSLLVTAYTGEWA